MTPREKAEELVNIYNNVLRPHVIVSNGIAKYCVLIAVDEVIHTLSKDVNQLVNFWFEVKEEIEKL